MYARLDQHSSSDATDVLPSKVWRVPGKTFSASTNAIRFSRPSQRGGAPDCPPPGEKVSVATDLPIKWVRDMTFERLGKNVVRHCSKMRTPTCKPTSR